MLIMSNHTPFMLPKKIPEVYENIRVYSIDGVLMFRCNRKKADWYLTRGLAYESEPDTLQLTFKTKGPGHFDQPYMIEDRINRCVCCGRQDRLTLHHVVPAMYRIHMPESIKSHSSHDILLVCIPCHDAYERHANALKSELVIKYNIPLEGRGWVYVPENGRVRKAATALLRERCCDRTSSVRESKDKELAGGFEIGELADRRENSKSNDSIAINLSPKKAKVNRIPPARIEELNRVVLEWWQSTQISKSNSSNIETSVADDNKVGYVPSEEILHRALELKDSFKAPNYISHGEYVIQQLATLEQMEGFVRMWRGHFLEYAKPRYISSLWSVDNPV
ncbi:uncharacterized protein VTP21DRAFT_7866 [Calcarisporiella thermophila]|uniref:uncharacterized protein n=1 Tax=Calcarisporiella thermophila TaxID=911321 RepID=UPI003742672E